MKSEYAINTRTPTIKTHDEYDKYYKKYIAEETVVEALAVKTIETTPLTPSPSSQSTRGPSPSRFCCLDNFCDDLF